MKIDRLLSITIILINRPFVTAKELSEKFEVSLRTIYRDIDSISAAGIPVTSCHGKGGGYTLLKNYRLDRQLLTLTDMIAILMALKGINTSLNNNDIDDTIEKIECLVPEDKIAQVKKHFENTIIDLSPWCSVTGQKETIEIINSAISNSNKIFFNYRNLKGEEYTRTVEPMTLILKTWCWYCYGFCCTKNDYRLFRLSRIHDCVLLNETFIRREQQFNDTDFLKVDSRVPAHLSLRFSPCAISKIEEYFSSCPRSTDQEGNYIVTVDYPEDEWLYTMILGFGSECEILSPPHIRKIIRDRLKKASENYNS